jgi:hypothetical protein
MEKMLFNITIKDSKPSIEKVCETFGFRPNDIDMEFGIISIDPEADLYCILVDKAAVERVQNLSVEKKEDIEGPFANPPIEPFGPPTE